MEAATDIAGLTVAGQDTTIALAAPIERVRYDVRAPWLTVVHVEPRKPKSKIIAADAARTWLRQA